MNVTACKDCQHFYPSGGFGGSDSEGRFLIKGNGDCTHVEAELVQAADYDYRNGQLDSPITVTYLSAHAMRMEPRLCGNSAKLFTIIKENLQSE